MRPGYTILAALLVAAVLGASGCARCGGGGDGLAGAQVPASLLELLPADADAVVVVRDLAGLSSALVALRPRLDALVGNIGMVETDVRNTLGIDPARLGELDAIGLDGARGLVVAVLAGAPVIVAGLDDAEVFVAHMQRVGSGQPFNMTAPVEEVATAHGTIYRMRRTADGNAKLSFATAGSLALVFPDARADEAALAAVATAGAGATLATSAELGAALSAWPNATVVAQVRASAAERSPELLEALGPLAARVREAGTLSLGLTLSGDAAELALEQRPTGEAAELLGRTFGGSGGDADFGRLVGEDAYFVARASFSRRDALVLARSLMPEAVRTELTALLADLNTRLGIDVENALVPALGENILVLATRARMLTLRRVVQSTRPNPGEAATAFGLVVALEVRDRAAVEAALDAIVASLEGRAERFARDGHVVIGFTDPQSDIGNLVLTDRLLILVPTRNRDDLLAQLAAADAAPPALRTETARELVGSGRANGAYVDMAAVVAGPIGATLGPMLPDEAMRAAGQIDHLSARGEFVDGALRVRLGLQFAAPAGGDAPATP